MYIDRRDSDDKRLSRKYFSSLVEEGDVVAITGEPFWYEGLRLLPAIAERKPSQIYVIDKDKPVLNGMQHCAGYVRDRDTLIHCDVFRFLQRCCDSASMFPLPDVAWVDIFGNISTTQWEVLTECAKRMRCLLVTFCVNTRRSLDRQPVIPKGAPLLTTVDVICKKAGIAVSNVRSYGDPTARMCEFQLSRIT